MNTRRVEDAEKTLLLNDLFGLFLSVFIIALNVEAQKLAKYSLKIIARV